MRNADSAKWGLSEKTDFGKRRKITSRFLSFSLPLGKTSLWDFSFSFLGDVFTPYFAGYGHTSPVNVRNSHYKNVLLECLALKPPVSRHCGQVQTS